jgi:hypothetical protein
MIIVWPFMLMMLLTGGSLALIFIIIGKGLFLLASLHVKLGGFIRNKLKGI